MRTSVVATHERAHGAAAQARAANAFLQVTVRRMLLSSCSAADLRVGGYRRLHTAAEEWLDGMYAAEILVRSLMIWNAAIYCTQVVRNGVMVLLR
jgi:hypothetical protein